MLVLAVCVGAKILLYSLKWHFFVAFYTALVKICLWWFCCFYIVLSFCWSKFYYFCCCCFLFVDTTDSVLVILLCLLYLCRCCACVRNYHKVLLSQLFCLQSCLMTIVTSYCCKITKTLKPKRFGNLETSSCYHLPFTTCKCYFSHPDSVHFYSANYCD